MKTIGLTGGIGSGKTTVALQFESLGIPVYIADDQAKALMQRSKVIKRKLKQLFGEQAYLEDKLNKPFLAQAIFNDKTLLEKMNAIVHPRVAKQFIKWKAKQKAPYCIKEVAILFENGSDKYCDYIITVIASKASRIERVIARDQTSEEKIKLIMNNQYDDDYKIKRSDFVIENETLEATKEQVLVIHKKILKNIKNS